VHYQTLEEMLEAGPEIDAVIVGTRCNLHTPIAVKIAKLNVPIFLEKPVCISWQQYEMLEAAFADCIENIVISFPLRITPLLLAVRQYITDGRLGTINQIQAVNNVSYGNVYVDSWYRDYELTGGLWLQKATHDFDYIHFLADSQPLCVTAMHSQKVWKEPVLHQDAGSAIVQYASGIHANYTQNFLTRKNAGKRGATITGEDGTISFDWYSETYTFHSHTDNRIENVSLKSDSGHGGGDGKLAANFIDVIRKRDISKTSLREGLLSAGTCLAARDAANLNKVTAIPVPFGNDKPLPLKQNIEPLD
jgi:predicted dehydrogenase